MHETMLAMNNKRHIGNAVGETKRTIAKIQLKRFCLMRFNLLSFHRIIRQTTATQFHSLFFFHSTMNFGDLLSCVLRKSLNHRSDITMAVRNCVCEIILVTCAVSINLPNQLTIFCKQSRVLLWHTLQAIDIP